MVILLSPNIPRITMGKRRALKKSSAGRNPKINLHIPGKTLAYVQIFL